MDRSVITLFFGFSWVFLLLHHLVPATQLSTLAVYLFALIAGVTGILMARSLGRLPAYLIAWGALLATIVLADWLRAQSFTGSAYLALIIPGALFLFCFLRLFTPSKKEGVA